MQNERYKVREVAPLNPIAGSHDDPTRFHPLLTLTPQIVSDFPLSQNTTVMSCLALALGVPPPSPLKKNRKSVRQQLNVHSPPVSLSLTHSPVGSPGSAECENQVSQQACCIFAPTVWGYGRQGTIADGMAGLQTFVCVCQCLCKWECVLRQEGGRESAPRHTGFWQSAIWPAAQKLFQHNCRKINKTCVHGRRMPGCTRILVRRQILMQANQISGLTGLVPFFSFFFVITFRFSLDVFNEKENLICFVE